MSRKSPNPDRRQKVSSSPQKKRAEGFYTKWEVSAPLKDSQIDKILELSDLTSERGFSAKLVDDNDEEEYNSDTPIAEEDTLLSISNANQFLNWFAKVESEMETQQEFAYRRQLNSFKYSVQCCAKMLSEIDATIEGLNTISDQYDFVSTKTESLHTACKSLLVDQQRLLKYAEYVSSRLHYFSELDRATLKLNSPKLSVLSPTFIPLLRGLDESISYISKEPDYRDSQAYLVKFRHLHSKALVFVKLHTYDTLKHTTNQALEEFKRGADPFAFLYAKFGARAPSIKALMDELESKCSKYDEYQNVLIDCQTCYFTQRRSLTINMLSQKLAKLDAENNITVRVRHGCTFTQRICQSEFQLYHRFFTSPCDGLQEFLEEITETLYYHFRPYVIKLSDIEKLAELCDILNTEVMGDQSRLKGGAFISFEAAVQQLLEDIQSRLMYRVQAHIKTDIGRFLPSAEDLNYPEKLIKSRNSESHDFYGGWYPPMHKTLICLSILYRCIDRVVFEGISHEAVSICRHALCRASEEISKQKTQIDGQLFLIKHLLSMREQLAPFEVDFVQHQHGLDWQSTKDAAFGLFQRTYTETSNFFSLTQKNAFVQFLAEGAPTVTEQTMNSKEEINSDLRKACESFFEYVSVFLASPISEFLKKAQGFEGKLTEQDFASVDKVKELAQSSYNWLIEENNNVNAKMHLYLDNVDTEKILFSRIRSNVMDYYREFHQLINLEFSVADQSAINSPTVEKISLALSNIQN